MKPLKPTDYETNPFSEPGKRPRQKGQALVETALSMMILIIMLAGMVDLGLALGHRVALTSASRAGARYGSRYPQNAETIKWIAMDALYGTLVLGESPGPYNPDEPFPWPDDSLEIEVINAGGQRGEELTVIVRYDYQPLLGGLLGIVGPISLGSSNTMIIAGPDQPYQPYPGP